MKFGENLQKLRKEQGISQEQLAEKLGVTRQSVSKWESGASYPEMDKIVALCNMFHCDLDVLINKDVMEERERKDASSVVKNIFQGAANYVKKTIYLFEHKGFKDYRGKRISFKAFKDFAPIPALLALQDARNL